MSSANVTHGGTSGVQCLTGFVTLRDTGLIGATVGTINTFGLNLPIRQVPGPANQGPLLSDVDNQLVRVCGQFQPDPDRGVVLQVVLVQPVLFANQQ